MPQGITSTTMTAKGEANCAAKYALIFARPKDVTAQHQKQNISALIAITPYTAGKNKESSPYTSVVMINAPPTSKLKTSSINQKNNFRRKNTPNLNFDISTENTISNPHTLTTQPQINQELTSAASITTQISWAWYWPSTYPAPSPHGKPPSYCAIYLTSPSLIKPY